MASVAPQVTIRFLSGSQGRLVKRVSFFASAWRSGVAPQVTAYWWLLPSISALAASRIARGGLKSGNPCDRLIAPCCCATRVISRMSDSVNVAVRRDVRGMERQNMGGDLAPA